MAAGMDVRALIGEPTMRLSCPWPGCTRKVGPYYSEAQAKLALAEHRLWRHVAVYQARG